MQFNVFSCLYFYSTSGMTETSSTAAPEAPGTTEAAAGTGTGTSERGRTTGTAAVARGVSPPNSLNLVVPPSFKFVSLVFVAADAGNC